MLQNIKYIKEVCGNYIVNIPLGVFFHMFFTSETSWSSLGNFHSFNLVKNCY